MGYSVIQLGSADWNLLRDLRLAALLESDAIYGDFEVEANATTDYWQQLAQDQTWLALRSEAKDLAGLVCLMPSGSERYGDFWIKSWWISPDHRGKGGARVMVDWCSNYVRQNQGKVLALGVFETNEAAINAFLALGFEKTGIRNPSTRPGAFYLIMAKELNLE